MKNYIDTNLFYQFKEKANNNINRIQNNNENFEINWNLKNQLNQLNQIHNNIDDKNQQLKMELRKDFFSMKKVTQKKKQTILITLILEIKWIRMMKLENKTWN